MLMYVLYIYEIQIQYLWVPVPLSHLAYFYSIDLRKLYQPFLLTKAYKTFTLKTDGSVFHPVLFSPNRRKGVELNY